MEVQTIPYIVPKEIKGHLYYYLYESYREDGKVKHKYLKYFGKEIPQEYAHLTPRIRSLKKNGDMMELGRVVYRIENGYFYREYIDADSGRVITRTTYLSERQFKEHLEKELKKEVGFPFSMDFPPLDFELEEIFFADRFKTINEIGDIILAKQQKTINELCKKREMLDDTTEEYWADTYGGQKNWELTREAVFKRNNYTCVMCGRKDPKLLRPHHIIPLSKGGTNELRNIITVCRKCHQILHPNNPNIW